MKRFSAALLRLFPVQMVMYHSTMFFYHVDENVALTKWKVLFSQTYSLPSFSTLFLQIQSNSYAKQRHSLSAAFKKSRRKQKKYLNIINVTVFRVIWQLWCLSCGAKPLFFSYFVFANLMMNITGNVERSCDVRCQCRRGFTIRLKRLKSRAPEFGGPKILAVRTISSISVGIIFVFFVLIQRTFFYYASNQRSI